MFPIGTVYPGISGKHHCAASAWIPAGIGYKNEITPTHPVGYCGSGEKKWDHPLKKYQTQIMNAATHVC